MSIISNVETEDKKQEIEFVSTIKKIQNITYDEKCVIGQGACSKVFKGIDEDSQ